MIIWREFQNRFFFKIFKFLFVSDIVKPLNWEVKKHKSEPPARGRLCEVKVDHLHHPPHALVLRQDALPQKLHRGSEGRAFVQTTSTMPSFSSERGWNGGPVPSCEPTRVLFHDSISERVYIRLRCSSMSISKEIRVGLCSHWVCFWGGGGWPLLSAQLPRNPQLRGGHLSDDAVIDENYIREICGQLWKMPLCGNMWEYAGKCELHDRPLHDCGVGKSDLPAAPNWYLDW